MRRGWRLCKGTKVVVRETADPGAQLVALRYGKASSSRCPVLIRDSLGKVL